MTVAIPEYLALPRFDSVFIAINGNCVVRKFNITPYANTCAPSTNKTDSINLIVRSTHKKLLTRHSCSLSNCEKCIEEREVFFFFAPYSQYKTSNILGGTEIESENTGDKKNDVSSLNRGWQSIKCASFIAFHFVFAQRASERRSEREGETTKSIL